VIKIIAVLCGLSSPANCHEQTVTTSDFQTVTTSDFADVSMQSRLMGAPQLAEWRVPLGGRYGAGTARPRHFSIFAFFVFRFSFAQLSSRHAAH
jgi:hypothetical protein